MTILAPSPSPLWAWPTRLVVCEWLQTCRWELASHTEGLGHLDWPLTNPASDHQARGGGLGFLSHPEGMPPPHTPICNLGLRREDGFPTVDKG